MTARSGPLAFRRVAVKSLTSGYDSITRSRTPDESLFMIFSRFRKDHEHVLRRVQKSIAKQVAANESAHDVRSSTTSG
jgi:hypothetical protein